MAWKWFWNTETKYYDGEITRDTDWGGDASTENQPVSGGRIQEWLKNEINGKYGVIRISDKINEQNFYTIEMFATKKDEELYDEDNETYADLINKVVIPISAVQGDSYTAFLTTTTPANDIIVTENVLNVKFNFRAVKYTQGQGFNEGAYGTLIVQRSTDNGSTYDEVGRLTNVLTSREPNDTTSTNEVNLAQFLTQGSQKVRVRASYDYEDANSGQTKTQYSSWVNIGNTVTKTELKLELVDNFEQAKSAKDVNVNDVPFSVSYNVFGSVQKTLYLEVSDNAGSTTTATYSLDKSVDSVNQTFNSAINMNHGVKKVKAWLEANDGLGNTIKSKELVNRFMVVNPYTPNVDLNKPYLLLQNVDGNIDNFVKTELAKYAVYSNGTDSFNLSFLLTSYAEEGKVWDKEYYRLETIVEPNKAYDLNTTIEIEGEEQGGEQPMYTTYFRVRRTYMDGSTNKEEDFIKASTNESYYKVDVDNSNGFTPVAGATFLMNPKVRNNSETDPKRILNAKNNNAVVDSVWTNFGFINDGWMMDDGGNKVLRVMAGSTLEIKKNVWAQFASKPNSSLTFEIDCAVRNVTNTTDPIIQMCDSTGATFKGLRMNALEGWLMNGSNTSKDDCLFAWQEDVRTHFSINLNHQVMPNKGDVDYTDANVDKANGTIAFARVLVNGDCVREMKYKTDSNDWAASSSIIIGNEGADIDIYSIRIYEDKVVDMVDILNRNYLASLNTSEEKVALKEKNNLLDGGKINLELAKNKGLNCMVWHGILPFHGNQAEQTGWIEYFRYDQDGNYLPEYSGTNCKETKSLVTKGQGSTAKTYYDWNQQDDNSKVEATIQVALDKIHPEIKVGKPYTQDGKQYVDIYGGNLGKNAPIEIPENAKPYEYINGKVTVPDGWIDGNGMYRGMGYRVAEGTSLAQKKVIKINYASSMQSHLIGACNTYDLLHRKVVGDTPLQQLIPDAVSAKRTEPFMFFNENGKGTFFKGMGNYGAGKADKVTWGFVKKQMPMYALIEGSDNNLPMTEFRVPFDKNTAVYDVDGEGYLYNGQQSWDFDLGNTFEPTSSTDADGWQYVLKSKDNEAPTALIRDKWADIHNFIYLHSTNLKYFVGTFEQFQASEQAKDTGYKYWCTDGDQALYLKSYDFIGNKWINAGLMRVGTSYHETLSLDTIKPTNSVYKNWQTNGNGDYNQLNEAFKDAFSRQMKEYLKYFINEKSLLFNYGYVLQFLAGTDNSAKNTYYKIDPIGVQMEIDESFATWYKNRFRKDFDFTSVHQLYFDGDDMDSILRTNNNAHQTKPYYIERMYPYADGNPTDCLYEGIGNQLFNYVEKAYKDSGELQNMMKTILNAAAELVKSDDKIVGLGESAKVSAWGFLHKYFFNIQNYFPQIAYLEQARIRYEFPELLGFISSGGGARNIRPITQSLGSQLQNELQYMNQRLIYFASYASYGAFGGDSNHAIGLADANETFGYMPAAMPDGSGSTHTFTVKSHQYIYPCYYNGGTFKNTNYRLSPNDAKGCTFTIAESVSSSDTGIGICGINYLTDLGDFKDKCITADLTISGKRLVNINNTVTTIFRPKTIAIKAANVTRIYLNLYLIETLDFSKQIRARQITVGSAKDVVYPETNTLTIATRYGTCYYVRLKNVPNLESFSITYPNIKVLDIGKNVGTNIQGFSVQSIAERIYTDQKSNLQLKSIHVENVNWKDFDVEALSWFADIPTCEFKGAISIKEDDPYGNPRVTWDLKNKFNKKFNFLKDGVWMHVDNGSAGLKLIYNKKPFDESQAKIHGNFYVEAGETFQFKVKPSSMYENDHFSVEYADDNSKFDTDKYSGIMTVKESLLPNVQTFVTVVASVRRYLDTGNKTNNIYKTIEIWNRPAQPLDLVFADGTFLSPKAWNEDKEKTPIAFCIYAPPRKADGSIDERFTNPNDKQQRICAALEECKVPVNGEETSSLQWGAMIPQSGESDSWNEQYALYDLDSDNKRVKLTSASMDVPNVYDIQSIQNLSNSGLTNPCIDPNPETNPNGASDYRDSSDLGWDNGGFKPCDADTAFGDGFAYNESKTFLTARTLTKSLASFAGSGYTEGDIVNSGYAKTLKIVAHRNTLLGNDIIGADGETLIAGGRFPIPSAGSGYTEMESLGNLIDNLRNWASSSLDEIVTNRNKWSQLCYPYASACYAYQPTMRLNEGEVLADRFRPHNWFGATEGLLARIRWYAKYADDTNADVESLAIVRNLLKISSSSDHWSVTEGNSYNAWIVNFSNGYPSNPYKPYSLVGRAVSAF